MVTYATLWEGLTQNDSYPKESLGKRFRMSPLKPVDLAMLETPKLFITKSTYFLVS